jgi:hypothetical protein
MWLKFQCSAVSLRTKLYPPFQTGATDSQVNFNKNSMFGYLTAGAGI